jgi:predicted DNA-binding protein
MTLAIDIPPELEQRLVNEARRLGVPPAEYARQLLQQSVPDPRSEIAATEDLDAALDQFFTENPEVLPSLPADFSRADIYLDHD